MLKKIISILILRYLRFFARLQLQKNPQATIVGVTGSAGKTSARLAIVQILRTKGIVKHSSHANSESGIPLNILGLAPHNYSVLDWIRLIILAPWQLLTNWERFNYYIVEMGIDSADYPKNMNYLLSIVRPHIALVLGAGLSHSAGFDYLVKDVNPTRRARKLIQLIAMEKMKLVKSLGSRGVAIVNIDQSELASQLRGVKARQLTIGKSTKAHLRIIGSRVNHKGSRFTYSYQSQKYELALNDIFLPSYASTFAGAIAVGSALGVSPKLSITTLSSYHAPAGRLRQFSGLSNSTIIDSSYNASPVGMQEALTLLSTVGSKHHKIAVIGDMNELGLSSKFSHKQLANWIMTSCDQVVLFGNLTKQYTLPILQEQKFRVHHFTHILGLIKFLQKQLNNKSLVLVKGSQNGILLERAVEAILADPSDVIRLCRRGPYWDKIRASMV